MKIRIVDTLAEPNIIGNVNVSDTKAIEIIDLFLDAVGNNSPIQEEKMDNLALELKRHMIKVARDYLRYTRTATFEAALNTDSSQYD